MKATSKNSTHPYYWDNFRDTSMGRYLFQHEIAFINRFLSSPAQGSSLLDASCGSGRVTLPLKERGLQTVGLDLDPVALDSFRQRSSTAPLVKGDSQRLPFTNGRFNYMIAIQSFDFLEHRLFLQECNRVLLKEGLLIFDALNRHSYKWLLKKAFNRMLDLPSANLSLPEIRNTLVQSGFDIEAIHGYNWLPLERESNNSSMSIFARIEKTLQLNRYYTISPKILIAARKSKELS